MQNPETTPGRLALVEAALITIRNGLSGYVTAVGEDVRENPELADFNACQRGRNFGITGFIALKDGFVLQQVTRSFLADYSHRLKVPNTSGPVEYHRDAYNVDYQCVTPSAMNLSGEVEISSNADATITVLGFERDVLRGALTNWEGFVLGRAPQAKC